jgi:hypothetical protein
VVVIVIILIILPFTENSSTTTAGTDILAFLRLACKSSGKDSFRIIFQRTQVLVGISRIPFRELRRRISDVIVVVLFWTVSSRLPRFISTSTTSVVERVVTLSLIAG